MKTLTNLTISFLQGLPLIEYEEYHKTKLRAETASSQYYIAVVSAAVFVGMLVFQFVIKRIRKIPRSNVPEAATSPPRASLSLICWALAVACIIAIVYLLYLQFTTDPPDSIFLLVVSLMSLGGALFKQGDRLSTPLAEDVLASDQRRPIVFLRSFSEEEMPFHQSSLWGLPLASEQFEEAVLDQFRRHGPVVGLTNPNLSGRPIAYSPYDTRSEYWRPRVQDLLKRSGLIAVLVGKGAGLLWEIVYIAKNGYLSRTIFIFPPIDVVQVESRLGWLQSQFDLPADKVVRIVDDNKSTMGRQPLTMRLDAGLAQVFVGSPDALGYVEAVGRALKN
jgi:hypothetical protein